MIVTPAHLVQAFFRSNMDIKDFTDLQESWEALKTSSLPVCIYGTGNACERILEQFEQRGIFCSGIFASDSFARGQIFHGYKVETLSQIEQRLGDIVVCCAFGSSLPDVMRQIRDIAAKHKLVFPDLPVAGDELFSKRVLLEMFTDVQNMSKLFADDLSVQTFINVLKFKITGDISFLDNVFSSDKTADIIALGDDEIYADLGAYTGDTAEEFIQSVGGKYKRIYTFEPDKRNFRKCVRRLMKYDNITMINACAWCTCGQQRFSQSSGRQSKVGDNGTLIAAKTLDSAVGSDGCTLIKYDVEGAEREALAGSEKTITRFQPQLAVSVYHRPYDMLELTKYVHKFLPNHRLYLRQIPYYPAWDTILYAVK